MKRLSLLVLCCAVIGVASVFAAEPSLPVAKKPNGNRLTYLDEPCNPYYVHKDFPKLTTPMWVGEDGVEAVVILGIDDMRGHEKWEAYLRPILNRLKQIDGRASGRFEQRFLGAFAAAHLAERRHRQAPAAH